MRPNKVSAWMPDSYNGGDILISVETTRVKITVERGMRSWTGCTLAAEFYLSLLDIDEFIQGLKQLRPETPQPAGKAGESDA